jgi:hypothetical protein
MAAETETGAGLARGEPRGFDWRVYADATCAGLTALIPVPLLDIVIERTFRKRMPAAIARVDGRSLRPEDRARLGRSGSRLLSLTGCLMLPLAGIRYLARFIWHKLIYVLAVADAARLVSAYWHRAYLTDHMIRAGHLEEGADTDWAIQVFFGALDEADTSPLTGLARQLVSTSRHIFGMLLRAARLDDPQLTETLGEILSSQWTVAERSLREVALRYNELYVQRPEPPAQAGTAHPRPDGGAGAVGSSALDDRYAVG